MTEPTSVLFRLIKEDFGITGNGRWFRSDEHSSLVFDAEKDTFYYNSEGISGDAYVYLTKIRHWSHDTAKNYLNKNKFAGTFIQEISNGEEFIAYPKLADVFHENIWSADRGYFHRRLITDSTISRFKLGYHQGYYTIPIYQDGLFKQIQMRRDSPKLITNYYKQVGPLLFNSDILKLTSSIILSEGIIGAILLAQYGIPAISMNIGCEGFQTEWIQYFNHQKEITILFDNDKAGLMGAIRTAKILGQYRCKIYNFWDIDGKGYAVDDYFIDGNTPDDLMNSIKEKSKYAFELEKPYVQPARYHR